MFGFVPSGLLSGLLSGLWIIYGPLRFYYFVFYFIIKYIVTGRGSAASPAFSLNCASK